MSQAMRKEWAALAGLSALACGALKKKDLAYALGLLAAGLRFLPSASAYSFRGKAALVTGGSRGFGLALAEQLLKEGARVGLLARDAAELERAGQLLRQRTGGEVSLFVCDVTDPGQVEATFRAAHERWGALDFLVNNAGAVAAGPFASMNDEDFAAQLRLHLLANVSTTRAILPYFAERGGGRILNVSSLGGKMPLPHMSSYAASKFALGGFSASAGAELAARGVKVTTVYPGLMRTGSPIQGVFRGQAEKEFAWFLAGDITPVLSQAADAAARQALAAVRTGRREVILSWPARLGAKLYQVFPETFLAGAAWAARALPAEAAGARKTGAAAKGLINNNKLGRFLLARNARFGERWNQREKCDASFNLNARDS